MRTATILGHIENISGWKPSRPDHRDHILPLASVLIPPVVNLQAICPRTENQRSLGSCTAHTCTSMMEALYKVQSKPNPELSRLFLYYMTRVKIEGTAPTDDSGCYVRDVLKAMAKFGVCVETLWPYVVSKFSAAPPATAVTEAKKHQILRYFACPTLAAVKQSIAAGYPCVGGFAVPENMMSADCARTGVVNYPTPNESIIGGHCVMFMGYNDATGRLMFQNSWGTTWGDRGFGYLPYTFMIDATGTGALAEDFWTIRTEEMPALPVAANAPVKRHRKA